MRMIPPLMGPVEVRVENVHLEEKKQECKKVFRKKMIICCTNPSIKMIQYKESFLQKSNGWLDQLNKMLLLA